ncbi:hypothetical protein, partial [uncultured Alistipes sp.]|uniref:hypothetical protein n=1 Tax=uncultured Alistipes sp. TaxID=538949 RepID=UPI002805543F
SLKAGAKISTFLAFLQTFHNFFSIFYTLKCNRQIISEVSKWHGKHYLCPAKREVHETFTNIYRYGMCRCQLYPGPAEASERRFAL